MTVPTGFLVLKAQPKFMAKADVPEEWPLVESPHVVARWGVNEVKVIALEKARQVAKIADFYVIHRGENRSNPSVLMHYDDEVFVFALMNWEAKYHLWRTRVGGGFGESRYFVCSGIEAEAVVSRFIKCRWLEQGMLRHSEMAEHWMVEFRHEKDDEESMEGFGVGGVLKTEWGHMLVVAINRKKGTVLGEMAPATTEKVVHWVDARGVFHELDLKSGVHRYGVDKLGAPLVEREMPTCDVIIMN